MSQSTTQWQNIQDFLINLAAGDFSQKSEITEEDDEQLVALKTGINMLIEELRSTTISRMFFNSIYNGINDMLIVLDEKGKIKNVNHVVERLLMYSNQELVNKSVAKVIQVDHIDIVRDSIKNTSRLKEIGINFMTKYNKPIPVSCSFSVLYNNIKQSTGILLVAKDLSTLLDAKDQLETKNNQLNMFVYKASHDLKSPIASMMGIMSLADKCKDFEELKAYLKMAQECITKLDNIIKDLLILGRITYGELEYVKVDIKKIIDSILTSIQYSEGFQSVNFDVKVSDDAQFIITEKGLLSTILFNLIDNAIKYRQLNKAVNISVEVTSHDKGVLIQIKDDGIGIDKLAHNNIFNMFYRATSQSKGSGLGLYIVKTSVLKLEGSISFESALEKGTVFYIYIPSKDVDP